jgi:hypothetical protein
MGHGTPAWHGGGQGRQYAGSAPGEHMVVVHGGEHGRHPAGSSSGHIVVVHGGGHGLQTGWTGVGGGCLWCLRWCFRAAEAGTGQAITAAVALLLAAAVPDVLVPPPAHAGALATRPGSRIALSAKPISLVRIGTQSTPG